MAGFRVLPWRRSNTAQEGCGCCSESAVEGLSIRGFISSRCSVNPEQVEWVVVTVDQVDQVKAHPCLVI